MRIAILTTGNEIMAGNVIDSNAAWLSDKCWLLGHNVALHMGVGDNEDDIIESLEYASKRVDCVIVSGGLGATVDDITLQAAANFFDRIMVYHEDIWEGIKAFFQKINRVCSENNKKQAYLPDGAVALENKLGTAPGVKIKYNDVDYYFVPGVPKEMKQIFDDSIYPWLKEHSVSGGYYQKFLRCFGLPEATFDQMISKIDFKDVELSFRVSFPEIKIKLVARSAVVEEAKKRVEDAADSIRKVLGNYVYGEDEMPLAEIAGNLLKNKGYRLSVAESCTGGIIASQVTDIPGSSEYFERGYVTYSNRAKVQNLGVSEETLKKYGAVSEEVVKEMASGVKRVSGTDIGIAVTGIAGPGGGSKEKPVGTVYLAIDGPNGVKVSQFLYPRERTWFKELVATTSLDMLRRYLLGIDL